MTNIRALSGELERKRKPGPKKTGSCRVLVLSPPFLVALITYKVQPAGTWYQYITRCTSYYRFEVYSLVRTVCLFPYWPDGQSSCRVKRQARVPYLLDATVATAAARLGKLDVASSDCSAVVRSTLKHCGVPHCVEPPQRRSIEPQLRQDGNVSSGSNIS